MIRINGEEADAEGKVLLDYLIENGYSLKRIAVERNGDIVPKAKYEETMFCDGDKVEIVSFVGGG